MQKKENHLKGKKSGGQGKTSLPIKGTSRAQEQKTVRKQFGGGRQTEWGGGKKKEKGYGWSVVGVRKSRSPTNLQGGTTKSWTLQQKKKKGNCRFNESQKKEPILNPKEHQEQKKQGTGKPESSFKKADCAEVFLGKTGKKGGVFFFENPARKRELLPQMKGGE